MFSSKKIIYFFLILIILGCSKNSEKKKSFLNKFSTKDLLGTWEIVPSKGQSIYFAPNDKVQILSTNKTEDILLLSDDTGVRFLYKEDDQTPFGYFLLSELKQDVWAGVIGENIVRLVKFKEKKKSILE